MEPYAFAMGRRSRAVRLRAIPGTTLNCSRASKRTIPWRTFSSSRTIEASTTAWKHAPGWPSIQHVFIPKGACWLNLQEGWWRLFRRDAFAGQSFANADEIEHATCLATAHLNRRAKPWIWRRPPKPRRHLHRVFSYRL